MRGIEVKNVSKTYKDTKAVAHVNMTIKKGEQQQHGKQSLF